MHTTLQLQPWRSGIQRSGVDRRNDSRRHHAPTTCIMISIIDISLPHVPGVPDGRHGAYAEFGRPSRALGRHRCPYILDVKGKWHHLGAINGVETERTKCKRLPSQQANYSKKKVSSQALSETDMWLGSEAELGNIDTATSAQLFALDHSVFRPGLNTVIRSSPIGSTVRQPTAQRWDAAGWTVGIQDAGRPSENEGFSFGALCVLRWPARVNG
ncbi:hypothetical protein FB451DRAFT_1537601 [Mycena latifolia]|nr:hypothetical protein FB451DRAFT_1537601 [Mycena latifolia]